MIALVEHHVPAHPSNPQAPAQPGTEPESPAPPSGFLMIGGYQGPMSKKAAAAFATGPVEVSRAPASRFGDRSLLFGALALAFLVILGLSGALAWLKLRDSPTAAPQLSGTSVPAAMGRTDATIAGPGATPAPEH